MANYNPKPFPKTGADANPNGRPKKGYSISEWFREMLNSNPNVKEAIGRSIIKKALEGDTAAQRMVWQYMDGMPHQTTDITSGGKPIPILGNVSTDDSDKETAETQEKD